MIIDFKFFAYAVSLANALADLCNVTLFLPDIADKHYHERANIKVNYHSFHLSRLRYPSNLLTIYSLFKFVNQLKPDVVHQLSSNIWFNFALPLFPDVPRVTTVHDATRHPGDNHSIFLFTKQQWQRASRIIVHAESIKQQMLEQKPTLEERLNVIPIGAYDFYQAWATEAEAQAKDAPIILFFGRIWAYKGLEYLIKAEPEITRQVPEARIVIAGCGEPFEKYAQMMVNRDHFIVHNYRIPDEMIAPLFQKAAVVALPYIEASQSAVLNIAYAFGKPVVASAVGGIPEMVEEGITGHLVPSGDAESLARAIVRLLKDDESRQRMGENALAKSKNELSWATIAQQTLKVYQAAINDWTNR